MDAHIVSQVIGEVFFPLAVFLEQQHALDFRDAEERECGGSYVIHTRPLNTGGWYLH